MLEQGEAEAQRLVWRGARRRFRQDTAEFLETAPQEILFSGVVGIEGGAANICLVQDILDRDGLIALAQDQSDQRLVERFARTRRAPVDQFRHTFSSGFSEQFRATVR